MKEASQVPALVDSCAQRMIPDSDDDPPRYDGDVEMVGEPGPLGPYDYPRHVLRQACLDRHNAAINSLFLDGSVRKVGLKELWMLKWHATFDTANPWTKAGGVQPEDWPLWMRGFRDY